MSQENLRGNELLARVDELMAKGQTMKVAAKSLGVGLAKIHYWKAKVRTSGVKVVTYEGDKKEKARPTRPVRSPLVTLIMGSPEQVAAFYQKIGD